MIKVTFYLNGEARPIQGLTKANFADEVMAFLAAYMNGDPDNVWDFGARGAQEYAASKREHGKEVSAKHKREEESRARGEAAVKEMPAEPAPEPESEDQLAPRRRRRRPTG